MIRDREQLEERAAAELAKPSVGVSPAHPELGHRAAAADRRHAVTRGTSGPVEDRAQAFGGLFDLAKVVETETKLLELPRRHARQRVAWRCERLRDEVRRDDVCHSAWRQTI